MTQGLYLSLDERWGSGQAVNAVEGAVVVDLFSERVRSGAATTTRYADRDRGKPQGLAKKV